MTPLRFGFPTRATPSCVGRAARGITLVELVVVMVIAALLAAIAMASYRSYTLQARRATAITALTDAASRQEQFFLNNRSYTSTLGPGGLNMASTTQGGSYVLSVEAPTAGCPIARCWSMRATPQGTQADDTCGILSYDSDGERAPANCW
jgi:type IV pilus assembly protein PilE